MQWTVIGILIVPFYFYLVEKEMATHSSTPAWKIPRTEDPGGLQTTGPQRVRHDWAHTHTYFHLEPRWSGETVSFTDSQFRLLYTNQAIQSHAPQLSPLSGSQVPLRPPSTHPNHPGTRYQTNAESQCGSEPLGGIHTGQTWARADCLPCPRLLTPSAWLLLTLVLPSVALHGVTCLLSVCGHKLLPSWHSLPYLHVLPSLIKANWSERERCSVESYSWWPHEL